jgi:nucleoside-diphosphate-sugar epimerase
MLIAVTGSTGFLGRYIVNHLRREGHHCRAWYREGSDRGGFDENVSGRLEWLSGGLNDPASTKLLVTGVEVVVHAALYRPGPGFRRTEGDLVTYAERNLLGSLRLMAEARAAGVRRFIFISTCAVHEVVLNDRPLDEAHPIWPTSHYGAHKAAIEKFVHSYGLGEGWEICAIRPTGIYGLARPIEKSKWFPIVKRIKAGESFASDRGGKEVHAGDVAKAVGILLKAPGIAGQAYNCCDLYVADQDVARIAKEITGSSSEIADLNRGPKNRILTDKLRALGMTFGGRPLLEDTIRQMLDAMK